MRGRLLLAESCRTLISAIRLTRSLKIARLLVEDHLLQTPPRNDHSKIHQLAAQAVPRSGGQACIHQLLADPGVGSLLSLLHRSVFLGLLLQSEYLSV